MLTLDLKGISPGLLLGTSSWSTADWKGILYPEGAKERDFITEYARRLPTVEIDSTFYRSPSPAMVDGWNEKTPEGFIFSAKAPQSITHEKALEDCGEELDRFLSAMSRLGSKLGPIVFQFPYVAKGKDAAEYKSGAGFRRRLAAFLEALPGGLRYAVEIRNRTWLDKDFLNLLRSRGVALVLSDYFTMPRLPEIEGKLDPVTADFAYVRFLGNRKVIDGIIAEKKAAGKEREFDEILVDRTDEVRSWIAPLRRILERTGRLFVYFNNHYAGCGPRSVELFTRIWKE